MATSNPNPEALSELNAVKIDGEIKDFVRDYAQIIQEAKSERAFWDQNIQRYINLRYGIRQPKNFPWPNAANYVLPLIDSDINRIKPSYVNLINVTPIVTFDPYGPEDIEPARKREQLFDWRMRTKVNFFEPYVLGIDHMLEQGAVVYKVTWKYSTRTYQKTIDIAELPDKVVEAIYDTIVTDDALAKIIQEELQIDDSLEENIKAIFKAVVDFRQGKSEFVLDLVEKVDDQPELTACSIHDDITFPIDTTDLNEARFIDYRFTRTRNELKIAMKDGKFEKYSDEQIDKWASMQPVDKRRNSYITSQYQNRNNDIIWMHETCVWYDINNDGIDERCICTWPDADPSAVLRFIELPYDHGRWPYVLVKREINDPGALSSRGIPALDEDFQNGISTAFNQTVDNGTITNTPQVVYKRNALTNIRNVRYIPGNSVEVNGQLADYELRQAGNTTQPFLFQSAQYLKSWSDQRIGNVTSGLTSPLNMMGAGTAGNKTKKEIDVIEGLQSEVQSLDLQVFQEQMAEVYYQINALYDQFGDEEEYTLITNEQPVKISRREIQGKFNIIPNGKLDNSNPTLRANKSFTLLRAFLNDPDIRQRELKKLFLDDFDVKISNKIFKTDEEIKAEQAMQQQMQEQMKASMVSDQLSLRQISDGMDVQKEAALSVVQGKKYAPE